MMRVVGVVRVGCSVVSVFFGSRVIVCDVDLWSILCIKDCFAVDGGEAVERCTIGKIQAVPKSLYISDLSCKWKQNKRCNTAQSLQSSTCRRRHTAACLPALAGSAPASASFAPYSALMALEFFYIGISGLKIRQNGASLVLFFAPMIFLLSGLSLAFCGAFWEDPSNFGRLLIGWWTLRCAVRDVRVSQSVTGRRDACLPHRLDAAVRRRRWAWRLDVT